MATEKVTETLPNSKVEVFTNYEHNPPCLEMSKEAKSDTATEYDLKNDNKTVKVEQLHTVKEASSKESNSLTKVLNVGVTSDESDSIVQVSNEESIAVSEVPNEESMSAKESNSPEDITNEKSNPLQDETNEESNALDDVTNELKSLLKIPNNEAIPIRDIILNNGDDVELKVGENQN